VLTATGDAEHLSNAPWGLVGTTKRCRESREIGGGEWRIVPFADCRDSAELYRACVIGPTTIVKVPDAVRPATQQALTRVRHVPSAARPAPPFWAVALMEMVGGGGGVPTLLLSDPPDPEHCACTSSSSEATARPRPRRGSRARGDGPARTPALSG